MEWGRAVVMVIVMGVCVYVCEQFSQQRIHVELESLLKTERRVVWLEWRNQGGKTLEVTAVESGRASGQVEDFGLYPQSSGNLRGRWREKTASSQKRKSSLLICIGLPSKLKPPIQDSRLVWRLLGGPRN